jgi:hypothetical protein
MKDLVKYTKNAGNTDYRNEKVFNAVTKENNLNDRLYDALKAKFNQLDNQITHSKATTTNPEVIEDLTNKGDMVRVAAIRFDENQSKVNFLLDTISRRKNEFRQEISERYDNLRVSEHLPNFSERKENLEIYIQDGMSKIHKFTDSIIFKGQELCDQNTSIRQIIAIYDQFSLQGTTGVDVPALELLCRHFIEIHPEWYLGSTYAQLFMANVPM